ncbi:MAG: HDIG domain-containing protein [Bacteroidales bacterium]|nr:HDIG domain-containing protein [Bacteroidales bacterium]
MGSMIDHIKQNHLYISLFLAALILAFLIPNEGKFKYEYTRGRPWMYETLIAPVDFPILKNEAELNAEKNQKAALLVSYYNWSGNALSVAEDYLMGREEIMANRQLFDFIDGYIQQIYERGVVENFPDSNILGKVIIIQKNGENIETAASEVYTRKQAQNLLRSSISGQFPGLNISELFMEADLDKLIVPNLSLDKNATEMAHKNAIYYISPTKGMLYTGQLIVTKGETITADIEQLLDSYKAEYEMTMGYTGNLWLLKLGHFIFISGILVLFTIMLSFLKKEVLDESNKLYFMLLQLGLIVAVTSVVKDINIDYLYIIPFPVFALYITSFFTSKIVLPIYLIFMLPVVLIAQRGYEIYFLNVIAGGVVVYAFKYWNRGWVQFINSILVFLVLSLSYLSFRLIEYGSFSGLNSQYFLYFVWNAVLVVAAYPLVFLFEKIFGLLSNPRLRDLSDTTSPLLQKLSEVAPGTFQHSLQVANLAESAARDIGAYALLARVGALYHDIGKMDAPQYYTENQINTNYNPHENLTPMESARIIISHVDKGAEMAKKERLPQNIIDFILSHHGHSWAGFFYKKYLEQGGDPANKSEFTYKGILPAYKEQVIVMMADAVEAASRSVKDFSEESLTELVNRVVDGRVSDDQLYGAEISIREIGKVKKVFVQKLMQMNHTRVSYNV